MKWSIPLVCILSLSILSADNKGKGKGKGNGKEKHGEVVAVRFASNDVGVIRQYYVAHPVNLPPGLQKKVASGKPLPPGWQKKLQPFPQEVEVRLAPVCDYCGRGVIDGYGVVYDKKTSIILDIVQLAADILR